MPVAASKQMELPPVPPLPTPPSIHQKPSLLSFLRRGNVKGKPFSEENEPSLLNLLSPLDSFVLPNPTRRGKYDRTKASKRITRKENLQQNADPQNIVKFLRSPCNELIDSKGCQYGRACAFNVCAKLSNPVVTLQTLRKANLDCPQAETKARLDAALLECWNSKLQKFSYKIGGVDVCCSCWETSQGFNHSAAN
eukprot:CAMPEP_0184491900 /NCGR_PEP_ID=MMETSP0113_2-20130426/21667_1 /TAXON_ID=91329 /ORGANISM="Norrisiella sphaerica, Strain BC52" /LENGTH=194 /DNA_ID=CAMNT_0026876447 /DNA_START=16 /DNA_END=597 /DNA_ORIENTATION=+